MPDQERNRSYWFDTAPRSAFPRLQGKIEVDVAIVGGGIVGIMTARLLKDEGLSVAVVEAREVGGEVTGKSTAKITSQHNITYTKIARKFGEDGARLYGEANQAGLARIRALAEAHDIACEMETKPAFTYTLEDAHVREIEDETGLAIRLGLPASLTRDTGLPFDVRAAMRFDDQAQFHPVKYVAGLAATVPGGGCHVFEGSRVIDWDPDRIATAEGEVKAKHVVMATHMPLGQIGFFYAEAYPHIHPVIMGRADRARVPNGMYISVETPRHSVRGHRDEHGQDWLIFAGPAFKAGHVDEERANFADLERFAMDHFGVSPDYRWTNEDYTPMDGAPFIGWSSSLPNPYLVATGFNAWGITNGAAAAILISDIIAGRSNPWLRVFDATRVKPIAARRAIRQGQCRGRLAPGRRLHGEQAEGVRRPCAGRRRDPQGGRRHYRRVQGRGRPDSRRLGGLHPYGLPGRLERDRPDLGLPLPRLALHTVRRSDARPGRATAQAVRGGMISGRLAQRRRSEIGRIRFIAPHCEPKWKRR